MPEQGLATIDKSVQEINRWLKSLMSAMDTEDKQYAYQGLRAVLTTLRDRLPIDLCANLGSQLPLLVRGVYYGNYIPADTPLTYRRVADWLEAVSAAADNMDEQEALNTSRAVFDVLEKELDRGLFDKIVQALPDDIRNELVD